MKLLHSVAATLLASGMFVAHAQAQDVEAGEKVFKKCLSCHKVGPEAKNGVGPVLNGVFGRTAGTYEDYKYGNSLVAAGEKGLVWDEEQIAAYITDPKKFLQDYLGEKSVQAKMTFKLGNEQERMDVIAYLKNPT